MNRIDDSMPWWNRSSPNRSLGEWIESESRPKPMRTVSRPRIFLKSATTGIEPPSRVKNGVCPNTASIASDAACMAGALVSTMTPWPPWRSLNESIIVSGVCASKCRRSLSVMSSGVWSATRRHEILADALDGRTVLAPSPV